MPHQQQQEDSTIPYDGNGNYSLPTNSFAQPVTGTVISDTDAVALWADLTTALSTCVVDNQTSSPSLLNPKVLTKILDTNSNELLEFGTTGSAVNHVKVTNAATGNVPIVATAGEADIGIDFENSEGEELLQLIATPTAVNNVRITNATTGNAALIDVSETNSDLNLAGNGTGVVNITNANLTTPTVNTKTGRGIEFLTNPEKLLDISLIGDIGTSGAFTSSSGFASTTLSDASATAAIIRVFYRLSWSSDADVWSYFAARKAGESDAHDTVAIAGQRGTHASAAGTNQAYVIGEGTVPLDASSDFEYAFSFESSASLAQAGGIYLIGYYV